MKKKRPMAKFKPPKRPSLGARSWRILGTPYYEQRYEGQVSEYQEAGTNQSLNFRQSSFHSWLGKFESFNLSIHGQVNGAGWRINTEWCYLRMMSRLDRYFFNHLTSATHLVVKAPSEGPLGLKGINHISLGFYKGQMPALKNLHLEYIFISPELIDFFFGHDKTLESPSMRNCSADLGAKNDIPWYRFFDAFHNANLTKLRNLEILPKNAPLIDESGYRTVEDDENLPAEVKEARRALEMTLLGDRSCTRDWMIHGVCCAWLRRRIWPLFRVGGIRRAMIG